MIVLIIAHAGIPMTGKMTNRATNTRNRARIMARWYRAEPAVLAIRQSPG
jgi:hypothetical protein